MKYINLLYWLLQENLYWNFSKMILLAITSLLRNHRKHINLQPRNSRIIRKPRKSLQILSLMILFRNQVRHQHIPMLPRQPIVRIFFREFVLKIDQHVPLLNAPPASVKTRNIKKTGSLTGQSAENLQNQLHNMFLNEYESPSYLRINTLLLVKNHKKMILLCKLP